MTLRQFCFPASEHKKRDTRMNVSHGIRRRPTLPGRFQPSTISVLRLNFCVRDGNRWIPQAIVTGTRSASAAGLSPDSFAAARSLAGFSNFIRTLKTAQVGFRFRLTKTSASSSETHKSHWLLSVQVTVSGFRHSLPLSFLLLLFPFPCSLFPSLRSSPRPISIIKLHTLPRFHR